MRVLVIGSGAREHAFCYRLRQSRRLSALFCAPGNPGISSLAETVAIPVDRIEALRDFAISQKIDLTLVGPELPLTLGIVDLFKASGLRIFGPTAAAARIESSKDFTKELLTSIGVPTANYRTFTDRAMLSEYLESCGLPVVVKADGLAAGKGVVICNSREDTRDAIDLISGELNSEKVLVEDFLQGVEASYIVATDGERVIPMATAHDYKRLLDGQKGPNTGGMGAISPTPRLDQAMEQRVLSQVIDPVLKEMRRRGCRFEGFLYAGLMISPDRTPYVLEFNCRMGDPECQPIMRRMESELLDLLLYLTESSESKQPSFQVKWSDQVAAAAVLAAKGYPEKAEKGDAIFGIEQAESMPQAVIFHAGTQMIDGKLVTASGRVLTVTSLGHSISEARAKLYRAVDLIQFKGMQVRRDIGVE